MSHDGYVLLNKASRATRENETMVGRPWGQVKGFFVSRSWAMILWHCSRVQTVPALIAPLHAMDRLMRSLFSSGVSGSPEKMSPSRSSIAEASSSLPRTEGIPLTRKSVLPELLDHKPPFAEETGDIPEERCLPGGLPEDHGHQEFLGYPAGIPPLRHLFVEDTLVGRMLVDENEIVPAGPRKDVGTPDLPHHLHLGDQADFARNAGRELRLAESHIREPFTGRRWFPCHGASFRDSCRRPMYPRRHRYTGNSGRSRFHEQEE